jgi:predicted Zn-dependent protease
MNRLCLLLIIGLIGVVFPGCAANRSLYEAPLHDVGALSEKPRDEWQIEDISYDELANIKPGQRPAIDTDEAGLWMVMDQAEEKLKTSGHLAKDEKLNEYLKAITCRLVPEYCDDIRVYLIRVPYFNAAMSPNGAMQIWTGLLLRVQNEAQLAAVIGHEIAHYLRRHTLQRMRDLIEKTSALVFVQLGAALVGVPVAGDVIQILTIGSIQAFSRDHEREADGYGIALMSRAGYDPREAAKVWAQLIEENEADEDHKNVPIFLATHPASKERNEALKGLGERVAARGGPFELGEERFLEHIFPHRAEYLRHELHLRNFAKTEKLLDMLIERDVNQGDLRFFKGELYRLRGNEGDVERALAEYEKAAQTDSPPSEMHRAIGLLCIKVGKKKEALNALNNYLDCCPECCRSSPFCCYRLHALFLGEGGQSNTGWNRLQSQNSYKLE